ncbi:Leucine-rich repeat-containing protein 43, partial [Quaeritorhiza haematococci]
MWASQSNSHLPFGSQIQFKPRNELGSGQSRAATPQPHQHHPTANPNPHSQRIHQRHPRTAIEAFLDQLNETTGIKLSPGFPIANPLQNLNDGDEDNIDDQKTTPSLLQDDHPKQRTKGRHLFEGKIAENGGDGRNIEGIGLLTDRDNAVQRPPRSLPAIDVRIDEDTDEEEVEVDLWQGADLSWSQEAKSFKALYRQEKSRASVVATNPDSSLSKQQPHPPALPKDLSLPLRCQKPHPSLAPKPKKKLPSKPTSLSAANPVVIGEEFALSYFKTLRLVDRKIDDIGKDLGARMSNLRELSLTGNNVAGVDAASLPKKIEILHLNANRISDCPDLSELQHLIHLGLGYNFISGLSPSTSNASKSESESPQTTLPPAQQPQPHPIHAWFPAQTLKSLDLSFNELTDLDETVSILSSAKRLKILALVGNPIFLLERYRTTVLESLPTVTILDDIDRSAPIPKPSLTGSAVGEPTVTISEEKMDEDHYRHGPLKNAERGGNQEHEAGAEVKVVVDQENAIWMKKDVVGILFNVGKLTGLLEPEVLNAELADAPPDEYSFHIEILLTAYNLPHSTPLPPKSRPSSSLSSDPLRKSLQLQVSSGSQQQIIVDRNYSTTTDPGSEEGCRSLMIATQPLPWHHEAVTWNFARAVYFPADKKLRDAIVDGLTIRLIRRRTRYLPKTSTAPSTLLQPIFAGTAAPAAPTSTDSSTDSSHPAASSNSVVAQSPNNAEASTGSHEPAGGANAGKGGLTTTGNVGASASMGGIAAAKKVAGKKMSLRGVAGGAAGKYKRGSTSFFDDIAENWIPVVIETVQLGSAPVHLKTFFEGQ